MFLDLFLWKDIMPHPLEELESQLLHKSEDIINLIKASVLNKNQFLYNLYYLLHHGRRLSSNLVIQRIVWNLSEAVENTNFDFLEESDFLLLLRATHIYIELTVTYQNQDKRKIDDSRRKNLQIGIKKIRNRFPSNPQLSYELSSIEAYLNLLTTDNSLGSIVREAMMKGLSGSIAAILELKERLPDEWISDPFYIRPMSHRLAQEMQKHDVCTSEGKESIETILEGLAKLKAIVFDLLKASSLKESLLHLLEAFGKKDRRNSENSKVRIAQTWIEGLTHMLKNTHQTVFIEALLNTPPLALNHFQREEFIKLKLSTRMFKTPIRYFLAVAARELLHHGEEEVSKWSRRVLAAMQDDEKEKDFIRKAAAMANHSDNLWTRWMALKPSEESESTVTAEEEEEDANPALLKGPGASEPESTEAYDPLKEAARPVATETPVVPEILNPANLWIHELLYLKTRYDDSLREKFVSVNSESTGIQCVAITGMAGSGKTSLATQYLLDEKRDNSAYTLNFTVENEEQWIAQLRNLFFFYEIKEQPQKTIKCASPEEQEKLMYKTLFERLKANSNWILLLDNMDQGATRILENIVPRLLANAGQGRILITSQDSNLRDMRTLKVLSLDEGLNVEEAIALMHKVLEPLQESLKQLGTEEELKNLLNDLGRMPLDLVQAGSFLLASNQKKAHFGIPLFTYEDYRKRLEQSSLLEQAVQDEAVLGGIKEMPRGEDGALKTRKRANTLAVNKALRLYVGKRPELDLWRLLNFMSVLSGKDIPQGLLQSFLKEAKIGTAGSSLLDTDLQNLLVDLLVQAQKYSLVQIEPDSKDPFGQFHLRMHRNTQRELKESYHPHLMRYLASENSSKTDVLDDRRSQDTPHSSEGEWDFPADGSALPAEKHMEGSSTTNPIEQFRGYSVERVPGDGNCFFHALADQLKQRNIRDAEGDFYTHETLRAVAYTHVADNPSLRGFFTSEDLIDLGSLRGWVGDGTIQALANVMGLRFQLMRTGGQPDVLIEPAGGMQSAQHTIRLLYNGVHYDSLREMSAEQAAASLVDPSKIKPSSDSSAGIVAVFVGRTVETELLIQITSFINWLENLIEERQGDYLRIIMPHNIAFQAYLESQTLSSAAQLKKAHYYRCLAEIYCVLGDPRKAETLLRQTLEHIEKTDEKELINVLCMVIQANIERCLGRAEEAKGRIETLLPQLKRCCGDESVEVAKALEVLGVAYSDLGNPRQKRMIFEEEVLPIYKKLYNNMHIRVATAYFHLANAYGDMEEKEKQRNILEQEVLPIYRKHYGDKDTEIANALLNLAKAIGGLGNVQEKINILKNQVLPVFQERYGEQHIKVAYVLMSLALAYGNLGGRDNHEKRKKMLVEEVLPALERYYEKGNVHIAGVWNNIAITYGELGDWEEEKNILENRVLPVFRESYGGESYHMGDASRDLAKAYGALGNMEKKSEILENVVLPIYQKCYKNDHIKIACASRDLADAYRILGNNARACELLEKVLLVYKREYGQRDQRTHEVSVELAALIDLITGVPVEEPARPIEPPSGDHKPLTEDPPSNPLIPSGEHTETVNSGGILWKTVFGGVAVTALLFAGYYLRGGRFSAKDLSKNPMRS